jgi:GNAT superfamily N-acetyltransferase
MLVIREAGMVDLEAYETVPISFQGMARVDIDQLSASGGQDIVGIPTDLFWKHYDALEKPSNLPNRFDVSNWGTLVAMNNQERVGGAILAWNSFDFNMLEGRQDLAVMVDIRVLPTSRGSGIGRAIWSKAIEWCTERGIKELRVETQDINVGACCFYQAMGCTLHSVDRQAYAPVLDEVQIIWSYTL